MLLLLLLFNAGRTKIYTTCPFPYSILLLKNGLLKNGGAY